MSGHVGELRDNSSGDFYSLKSKVIASYNTSVQYDVTVTLLRNSGFVVDASYVCKSSALSRCSHVASVLIALLDYIHNYGNDPAACTSQPRSWNTGRKSGKDPKQIQDTEYSSWKRPRRRVVDIDPRPPSCRNKDPVKKCPN